MSVRIRQRSERAALAATNNNKKATKDKIATTKRNLAAVIYHHCEEFYKLMLQMNPDDLEDLSQRKVPRNQWFTPGEDGYHANLHRDFKDEYADSLLCWRLGHPPIDEADVIGLPFDKQFDTGPNRWLQNSFLTCSEEEVRHLIMLFGDEHLGRKKKTSDCKIKTLERYGASIWNLYHKYRHQLKINAGHAATGSTSDHDCLAAALPNYAGLLIAKGNSRLSVGNTIDATSHAVPVLSDPQAASVIRYCTEVGTVFCQMRLAYFLLALSTHRRAGKEQFAIKKSAISVVKHRGVHEVLLVDMDFEAKCQNFTKSCEYVQRAAVMVVCPLTVKLVKWMIAKTSGLKKDHLWMKPLNRQQRIANLVEDTPVFSNEAYAEGTVSGWVKTLMALAERYHREHDWPDIPYARAWPNGEADVVSGTGLRKRAETAMHVGRVPEKDALVHSGRAVDKSRGAYTEDGRGGHTAYTLESEFKIGCLLMCPPVMRFFDDAPPQCPIPSDLVTDCTAGVLLLKPNNWLQHVNTDRICRDQSGNAVYYDRPSTTPKPVFEPQQQPFQQEPQQLRHEPEQLQHDPEQLHHEPQQLQHEPQQQQYEPQQHLQKEPQQEPQQAQNDHFDFVAQNVSDFFSPSQLEPHPFSDTSSYSGSSSCSTRSSEAPDVHEFVTYGPCRIHSVCAETCQHRVVHDVKHWQQKYDEQQRHTQQLAMKNAQQQLQLKELQQQWEEQQRMLEEQQQQWKEHQRREQELIQERLSSSTDRISRRNTPLGFVERSPSRQTTGSRQYSAASSPSPMQAQKQHQAWQQAQQQPLPSNRAMQNFGYPGSPSSSWDHRLTREFLQRGPQPPPPSTGGFTPQPTRSSTLSISSNAAPNPKPANKLMHDYYPVQQAVITPDIRRKIAMNKAKAEHQIRIRQEQQLLLRQFQACEHSKVVVNLASAVQKDNEARKAQQQLLRDQRQIEDASQVREVQRQNFLRQHIPNISDKCLILFNPPLQARLASGFNTLNNKQIQDYGVEVCHELLKMDKHENYVPRSATFYEKASKIEWVLPADCARRIFTRYHEESGFRIPDYDLNVTEMEKILDENGNRLPGGHLLFERHATHSSQS